MTRFTATFTSDYLMAGRALPDLVRLLREAGYEGSVSVFGRGRFASLELDQPTFKKVQNKTDGILVFSPTMAAQPF